MSPRLPFGSDVYRVDSLAQLEAELPQRLPDGGGRDPVGACEGGGRQRSRAGFSVAGPDEQQWRAGRHRLQEFNGSGGLTCHFRRITVHEYTITIGLLVSIRFSFKDTPIKRMAVSVARQSNLRHGGQPLNFGALRFSARFRLDHT